VRSFAAEKERAKNKVPALEDADIVAAASPTEIGDAVLKAIQKASPLSLGSPNRKRDGAARGALSASLSAFIGRSETFGEFRHPKNKLSQTTSTANSHL